MPQLIGVLKTTTKIAGRIHTRVAKETVHHYTDVPMKRCMLSMSYRAESLPLPVVKAVFIHNRKVWCMHNYR